MDLNDVIKAKSEMGNSIRDFIADAIEKFEQKTGVTPGAINIHLGSDEIVGRTKYPRIRHCVIGVEAIITL